MTPSLDFALGAMVCFGVGDLIYKRGACGWHQGRRLFDRAGDILLSRRHALWSGDPDIWC